MAQTLRGGCLCGACAFELKGCISAAGKCHCSVLVALAVPAVPAVPDVPDKSAERCRGQVRTRSTRRVPAISPGYQLRRMSGRTRSQMVGGPRSEPRSPVPSMPPDRSLRFVPASLLDANPGVCVRGSIRVLSKRHGISSVTQRLSSMRTLKSHFGIHSEYQT